MYKESLALNNLQWLICHKTQPNEKRLKIESATQVQILNEAVCVLRYR